MPDEPKGTTTETEPTGIPVPVTETSPLPPPQQTVDGNGAAQVETKPTKTFTAEDIEKARKEEKDKLYKSLEDVKSQLAAVTKEREEREKAAKEAEKAAAAAAKAKAEEELSAKELLAQKEKEWEERFHTIEQNRERSEALLEQERRFSAIQSYRTRRLTEESDDIMPELIDYITGTSEDEIEAAIQLAKEKTAKVVGTFQQQVQQQRQQAPGTKVTSPPVGPMEQNNQGYETLTADDIRGMDMATYAKRREQLLGAAGKNRNKGLFD